MSTIDLTPTLAVVRHLVDDQEDLTPTVTVVGDVGRLLRSNPPPETVATLMSGIAAAREQVDPLGSSPLENLRNGKSTEFAGGALWACEDILDAWRRAHAAKAERAAGHRDRAACRQVVLDLLGTQATFTPSDVRSAMRLNGIEAHPSTVSKAIGDLLAEGRIVSTEPRSGASRRHRYYRSAATDARSENLDRARRLLADLNQQIGSHELSDLVRELTVEVETDLGSMSDA